MGDKERKMSLKELMGRLGDAQPGSIARPPLEAEYERRKYVWLVVGVIVTGIGIVIAAAVALIIHFY
jgi:hypothetical protein